MILPTNESRNLPTEPSVRTLRMLVSWEKNYGLNAIQQHLDDGLFSRNQEEHRLCYVWLKQRKEAKRNNALVEVTLALALVFAAGAGLASVI